MSLDWHRALDTFLNDWRSRTEVIGALVCGSFVTGEPNPRSDLNVHIVLSDTCEWRERGSRVIDGFPIDYFANPPRQIRRYFEEDHRDFDRMAATQFVTGEILFDTLGAVSVLKLDAQHWMDKPFPELPAWKIELEKLGLWDAADNVRDAIERGADDVPFLYHLALDRLFRAYAKHLRQPIPSHAKLLGFLTSERTRSKYHQPPFPDKSFVDDFVAAMRESDRHAMARRTESLTAYVLSRMGGYTFDGWRFRSPVDG